MTGGERPGVLSCDDEYRGRQGAAFRGSCRLHLQGKIKRVAVSEHCNVSVESAFEVVFYYNYNKHKAESLKCGKIWLHFR